MSAPSRSDLVRAARQFFDQLVEELDRPHNFPEDDWDNQIAFQVELSRERIGQLDRQLVTKVFDPKIQIRTASVVEEMGCELEALVKADQNHAMQLIARAERERLELLIHQLLEPAREFKVKDELFLSHGPAAAVPSSAMSQGVMPVSLQTAIDQYLDHLRKKNLSQSRVDETACVMDWLLQRFGSERLIGHIDKSAMRQFRHDIKRLDGNLQGKKVPFNERQTDDTERQIKSVTSIRYWRSVTGFIAWAYGEDLSTFHPTSGLKISAEKGETKRTREPFQTVELEKLFSTPLFSEYTSTKQVSELGDCH